MTTSAPLPNTPTGISILDLAQQLQKSRIDRIYLGDIEQSDDAQDPNKPKETKKDKKPKRSKLSKKIIKGFKQGLYGEKEDQKSDKDDNDQQKSSEDHQRRRRYRRSRYKGKKSREDDRTLAEKIEDGVKSQISPFLVDTAIGSLKAAKWMTSKLLKLDQKKDDQIAKKTTKPEDQKKTKRKTATEIFELLIPMKEELSIVHATTDSTDAGVKNIEEELKIIRTHTEDLKNRKPEPVPVKTAPVDTKFNYAKLSRDSKGRFLPAKKGIGEQLQAETAARAKEFDTADMKTKEKKELYDRLDKMEEDIIKKIQSKSILGSLMDGLRGIGTFLGTLWSFVKNLPMLLKGPLALAAAGAIGYQIGEYLDKKFGLSSKAADALTGGENPLTSMSTRKQIEYWNDQSTKGSAEHRRTSKKKADAARKEVADARKRLHLPEDKSLELKNTQKEKINNLNSVGPDQKQGNQNPVVIQPVVMPKEKTTVIQKDNSGQMLIGPISARNSERSYDSLVSGMFDAPQSYRNMVRI